MFLLTNGMSFSIVVNKDTGATATRTGEGGNPWKTPIFKMATPHQWDPFHGFEIDIAD
jgi:hypothetical protein